MRTNLVDKTLKAIGRRVMGTVTHVATEEAVVALTFDDGPHPEYTPYLLDILEKHLAQATFFMIGKMAQRFPKLVERVVNTGHTIGNHSWDHPSFPHITARERRAQIRACDKAIAPYGQRIFRPPYGHQSLASRFDALLLGYQVVTWNIVAQDWLDHDANWLVNQVLRQIKPGSIILFHDALYDATEARFTNQEPTLQAVDQLLKQLSDRFQFITVPELFRYGQPQRRNWYLREDMEWLNSLNRPDGKGRRYSTGRG